MIEKITPETYEKMNEEFEEEGLAFRIIVPTQEQIDMIGGIEVNKVCIDNIAKNLLKSVEELLDGKLKHFECIDKKTTHKKFVIEYDYTEKQ